MESWRGIYWVFNTAFLTVEHVEGFSGMDRGLVLSAKKDCLDLGGQRGLKDNSFYSGRY